MNDSEMQIAIAEACGYKQQPTPDGLVEWLGPNPGRCYIGRFRPNTIPSAFPDYLNDLNAMHEAEQAAWDRDYNLRFYFIDHLARIINPVHGYRMLSGEDLLDATARQRSEAFLKTLNLWKP